MQTHNTNSNIQLQKFKLNRPTTEADGSTIDHNIDIICIQDHSIFKC